MQRKCALFLFARRTRVEVGDFHVDSENGIPSSYVSVFVPRARKITIKNTYCPFRDGALLAHAPRSKIHTYVPNKRGDVCVP